MRQWLFAALVLLVTVPLAAQEPTKEEATEAQIARLQAEIAEIQTAMRTREGQRDDLQTALAETERALGALEVALNELETAVAAETERLRRLEAEQATLESRSQEQQAQMSAEVRNLWSIRQGGGLKILFGDQSPAQVARNLAYYEILLSARSDRISTFNALVAELEANASAIRETRAQLAERRDRVAANRLESQRLQTDRRETLARIEAELTRDSDRVAKLEDDTNRLTELLDQLRAALEELDTPASYKPFADARGELRFPVEGRPGNRFGARRNSADMRWRGWMIPATEGADVSAVHYGRVVYADWLRGQGLLLILDHGDGWLSLYGQNRSLNREVGDWVRPGDPIATVGASGGANAPGLYFEIRKDGQPVDPGKWLPR